MSPKSMKWNEWPRPNLFALHAVLSHFSVFEEPAIVSLPTGYGKTAVIMALPFVLEATHLLVVEPSDALRGVRHG
jgi:superfamily II DNA or RNA helicase